MRENLPLGFHSIFHRFTQLKQYQRLRTVTVNLICILQLYSELRKYPEFFFLVAWVSSRSLVYKSNSEVHLLITSLPWNHSIFWPLFCGNWFGFLMYENDYWFQISTKVNLPLQNDLVAWLKGSNTQSDHPIIPYILLQSMIDRKAEKKFCLRVGLLVWPLVVWPITL